MAPLQRPGPPSVARGLNRDSEYTVASDSSRPVRRPTRDRQDSRGNNSTSPLSPEDSTSPALQSAISALQNAGVSRARRQQTNQSSTGDWGNYEEMEREEMERRRREQARADNERRQRMEARQMQSRRQNGRTRGAGDIDGLYTR